MNLYRNDPNSEYLNQARMKLEDYRSHSMRESENLDQDFDLRSSIGENFRKSELEIKEISSKEVLSLYKQAKSLLNDIENSVPLNKTLKFAGVLFNFNIIGTHLPAKKKLLKPFLPEKDEKVEFLQSQILALKHKLAIPNEVLTKFLSNYEEQMQKSFQDHCCDTEFSGAKKISSKEIGDKKSWTLLQRNFNQLKKHHQKCENIGKELQWQNIEAQLGTHILCQKFQGLLIKEGELGFRQSELTKSQQEYRESLRELNEKILVFESDQKDLDREKRKLERMKELIKTQMEEINKLELKSVESKRTSSASRLTENSPTLRRIRSHSRNGSFDSEIMETQNEISKLETSLEESNGQVKDVRLSKLYTKLSNLKTQKALERNLATSDSMQSVFSGSKEPAKRVAANRDLSPRPEPSKPPMYRKAKACKEVPPPKSLLIKEERIAEKKKEAEIQQREKEIYSKWLKVPNNAEAVDQIQNEISKLRSLQREYDEKIKSMQSELMSHARNSPENLNGSVGMSEEESSILQSRIKKLNDLYSMIEEII